MQKLGEVQETELKLPLSILRWAVQERLLESDTAALLGKVAKIPPMRTIRRAMREVILRLAETILSCPPMVERFMLRDLLLNIYTPNRLDVAERRFFLELRPLVPSN